MARFSLLFDFPCVVVSRSFIANFLELCILLYNVWDFFFFFFSFFFLIFSSLGEGAEEAPGCGSKGAGRSPSGILVEKNWVWNPTDI